MSLSQKELKKLQGVAKQEASKFAKLGSDVPFMVINLKSLDKDGELELPVDIINKVAETFREKAKTTGVMLVTVCNSNAQVLINFPETRTEITTNEWMESLGFEGIEKKDKLYKFQTFNVELKKKEEWSLNCSESFVTKELEEGQFLKYRDELIQKAFAFLNSKNLLPEDDESDEEVYSFD